MFYSPILFSEIADINITQYCDNSSSVDFNKLNSNGKIIIYSLHSQGALNIIMSFLHKIKVPFIIISAMEDTQLPLEIDNDFMNTITSNIYFKHWFSINKTIPNNKYFTSIPYGLDYWTMSTKPFFGENIQSIETQNSSLQNIADSSVHFSKRIPLIYVNFHLNLTDTRHGGWRQKIPYLVNPSIIHYQQNIIPRTDVYKNMINYSFIISPFGHGFDCIRTFEALCLGCIVIMKKSFLDIIYEELPVLLVDEWTDINKELLDKTLIEFSNKTFNYEKLKMKYWIDIVMSQFDNIE